MIEIVRATGRDRAALSLLLERIEREERPADPDAAASAGHGLERSLRTYDALASDSAWILGVRDGAEWIGYAVVARIPKLDARAGYLFVDELHVLAGHRRRGAATALVEAALALAAELDQHGVRLLVRPENRAARALYTRLGFEEHGTGLREKRVGPKGAP